MFNCVRVRCYATPNWGSLQQELQHDMFRAACFTSVNDEDSQWLLIASFMSGPIPASLWMQTFSHKANAWAIRRTSVFFFSTNKRFNSTNLWWQNFGYGLQTFFSKICWGMLTHTSFECLACNLTEITLCKVHLAEMKINEYEICGWIWVECEITMSNHTWTVSFKCKKGKKKEMYLIKFA